MSVPACEEDHDHTDAWFCVYLTGETVMRPAVMQKDFRSLVDAVRELVEVLKVKPA